MIYGFQLVTQQAVDIQGSGAENQRTKLRKSKQPHFGGFRRVDLEEECNIPEGQDLHISKTKQKNFFLTNSHNKNQTQKLYSKNLGKSCEEVIRRTLQHLIET